MHYIVENGKVWSPVLGCWAQVSLPMRRLINALNEHGYVDPIRDGGRSGTFVALMQRGILREAKGRAGRHYPATTPEQVYAEAWVEHGLRICDEIDAEAEAAAEDRARTAVANGTARRAVLTIPQDRSADGVPKVEQEPIIGRDTLAERAQEAIDSENECRERAQRREADMPSEGRPGPRTLALRAATTPAEQRTGVSNVQASIADEVAALRTAIKALPAWDWRRDDALARLDRIAALVPQRATDRGLHLWQHACGTVQHDGPEQPHPDQCDSCRRCRPLTSEPWHALFTVAGR
jgi:hypothetical protein